MKVKVIYFDGSSNSTSEYFHLCPTIREEKSQGVIRWFRDGRSGEGWLSIHNKGSESDHSVVDPGMFDYLMDKFGTLEGTYAEWEL